MENLLSIITTEYLPEITGYLSVIKIIIAFISGACIGSIVNVAALRITAEGKPRVTGCHICSGRGEFFGLISALLHLKLPCKCRTCGAVSISRNFYAELSSAALCALFVWRFDVSFACLFALVAFAFWQLHAMTDIENGYIYDLGILMMVVCAVLLRLWGGVPALINGAYGAATGFVIIYIIIVLTRGAMGTGDAMLMMGTGALLGWRLTLTVIYFGFIIGGLYVIPLLFTKRLRTKDSVPLAPFFACGGLISIFTGKWIYLLLGMPLLWPW